MEIHMENPLVRLFATKLYFRRFDLARTYPCVCRWSRIVHPVYSVDAAVFLCLLVAHSRLDTFAAQLSPYTCVKMVCS
mgnify:CR=1 FL=1